MIMLTVNIIAMALLLLVIILFALLTLLRQAMVESDNSMVCFFCSCDSFIAASIACWLFSAEACEILAASSETVAESMVAGELVC